MAIKVASHGVASRSGSFFRCAVVAALVALPTVAMAQLLQPQHPSKVLSTDDDPGTLQAMRAGDATASERNLPNPAWQDQGCRRRHQQPAQGCLLSRSRRGARAARCSASDLHLQQNVPSATLVGAVGQVYRIREFSHSLGRKRKLHDSRAAGTLLTIRMKCNPVSAFLQRRDRRRPAGTSKASARRRAHAAGSAGSADL
jgi:hypothetical protein